MLIVHCNVQHVYSAWVLLNSFCSFFIKVPPMIWVQNQLVGAYEGQRITLECQSEAYPKSINYWTREKGEIVPQSMLNFSLI